MRKRASTHTDGGILWWVPPTVATLVLRVEKSKSRHAHHALETSRLRFTCILGKKKTPSPFAHAASLGALCCRRGFPPPENPPPKKIEKVKILREKTNKQTKKKKSKVIHADRLNHSWQCVQLFMVRDAEERCASNGRILSCVSYPKCRGVYPAEQCGAHASADCSTPPTGKVRSDALFDRPHTQRAESGGSGGVWGGGTGEIISAPENTPTPLE